MQSGDGDMVFLAPPASFHGHQLMDICHTLLSSLIKEVVELGHRTDGEVVLTLSEEFEGFLAHHADLVLSCGYCSLCELLVDR